MDTNLHESVEEPRGMAIARKLTRFVFLRVHSWFAFSAVGFQFSAILIVAAAQSPDSSLEVVARVDGEAIHRVEVAHALAGIARQRPAADVQAEQLFSEMLNQIVRRRLALRRLEDLDQAASKYEMERALAKKRTELKKRARSLDDILAKSGITLAIYHRDLKWDLSWAKYRAESLTDEALEAFFDSHRREFDGTEVRARHVLLAPATLGSGEGNSSPVQKAREDPFLRAAAIRRQITGGQMTFVRAAQEFSTAPSGNTGGDLGFFPRHGVMHESVAKIAFELRKGEISAPIASSFGVHLIEATDELPGKQRWTDVRDQLRAAAERDLFEQLVAEQRTKSRVERIWNANGGEGGE